MFTYLLFKSKPRIIFRALLLKNICTLVLQQLQAVVEQYRLNHQVMSASIGSRVILEEMMIAFLKSSICIILGSLRMESTYEDAAVILTKS